MQCPRGQVKIGPELGMSRHTGHLTLSSNSLVNDSSLPLVEAACFLSSKTTLSLSKSCLSRSAIRSASDFILGGGGRGRLWFNLPSSPFNLLLSPIRSSFVTTSLSPLPGKTGSEVGTKYLFATETECLITFTFNRNIC